MAAQRSGSLKGSEGLGFRGLGFRVSGLGLVFRV